MNHPSHNEISHWKALKRAIRALKWSHIQPVSIIFTMRQQQRLDEQIDAMLQKVGLKGGLHE